MFSGFTQHTLSAVLHIVLRSFQEWVNRRTDRRISKIFLPGFRIQSEFLTYFRIAADCGFIYFFGPDFGLCL